MEPRQRHRLLTLFPGVRNGGAFKRLCMMLEAANRAGWDVHYVSPDPFPCAGRFHRLPLGRGSTPLSYPSFLAGASVAMAYVAKNEGVDRIAVFGEHLAAAAVPAKILNGIPLVVFMHGCLRELAKSRGFPASLMWAQIAMGKISLPFVDAFFAVSKDLRQRFIDTYHLSTPVGVMYNHVDLSSYRPDRGSGAKLRAEAGIGPDDFVVGYAGTLIPRKNVAYLIRAFAAAAQPNMRLLVAGTGNQEANLRALASSLGIADRTCWMGWRQDVPAVLNACDVTVLPSVHDDFSLSLLESLGCEVVALGSSVGGNTELLEHDELLFPLTDDGAKLTGTLRSLAQDPLHRQKLRELCESRRKLLTFDWDEAMLRAIDRAKVDAENALDVYGGVGIQPSGERSPVTA